MCKFRILLQKIMKAHISGEILLLVQDCLVAIELSVKVFEKFGGGCIIRWQSVMGFDELLESSFRDEGIEVADFDRSCLVV